MKAIVNKFRINFPGDVCDLDRIIAEEKINPLNIRAIISKTTGSGELNDYSRQFAEANFSTYLNKTHRISLDEIAKNILFITSRIIKDFMDIESIYDLLKSNEQNNLIGTFAKVSIDPSGFLRGQKIPLCYTNLNTGSMIRAVASGILVPIFINTEIFISGGGEHQGPSGGGILVAIFSKNNKLKGDNK